MLQYPLRVEDVCVDDDVGMFPRMGQAAHLFFVVGWYPTQPSSCRGVFERAIQKDQNIGLADHLPHAFRIRMFLRNVTAAVAVPFQPFDQCGLPRPARTDHPDQRRITFVVHFHAECWKVVRVRPARQSHPHHEACSCLWAASGIHGRAAARQY